MKAPKLNYRIQLTTLTPVSIGNGEVYSPYADYYYNAKTQEAFFLDKHKIDQLVEEAGLEDQYIEAIYASFDNNRSNVNVQSFLENNLKTKIDTLITQSITCQGLKDDSKIRVNAMLKNHQRPYIPGSTIKGAVKTALLYHWLKKEGKRQFDELMKMTLVYYKKCENEIRDIEEINQRTNLTEKQRKNKIRTIKNKIKDKIDPLKKKIDKTLNNLLTTNTNNWGHDFQHLSVSDTDLLDRDARCFQLCNRLHYKKGTLDIPIHLEAIPENEETDFHLSITQNFKNTALDILNDKDALTTLFKRINNFSKNNISTELDLLDDYYWPEDGNRNHAEYVENYRQFLEEKYKEINTCKTNEAYLSLGFGKSFFYNSIGMLINDWEAPEADLDEEDFPVFKKYAQLFFLGNPGQKDFPLTRTVMNTGIPMGWVKLSKKSVSISFSED